MSFDPLQCIADKRDGRSLTEGQIRSWIAAYTDGRLPDYQVAALTMAIYLQGMSVDETAAMTQAMLESGKRLQWPGDHPPIVDKHSTGGIGDKVSLVLTPLLACCGVWVPMISGRGLGPTGGTLDKLESIPGFRTDLTMDAIVRQTQRVGCAITGASEQLAPADRKLYGLRDVTATVASIPLITASIMSKKLAESLDALVLDVKFGAGAFMKSPAEARRLAESLVATGARTNLSVAALLTDMNQPLGRAIGNTVELNEAAATLRGAGPEDLVSLTLALGSELLWRAGACPSRELARKRLQRQLEDGSGWEKLALMVRQQGGDLDGPRAVAAESVFLAERAGYVVEIDNERFGHAVIELGGGRRKLGQAIDHSVGFEILVRIGDYVDCGQPLLRVFARPAQQANIQQFLAGAIRLADSPVEPLQLILDRIPA